jgi:hypothetical protein
VKKMDESNCDQDMILKVFNLVAFTTRCCERYCENRLGELNKACDQLHRRLEVFEQQVSRLNERNEKLETDIKDIKGHLQNKKKGGSRVGSLEPCES